MRLLIIANSGMQLTELRIVLSHLRHVLESPELEDRVAQQEPTQCSGWTLEQWTEVKSVIGSWS